MNAESTPRSVHFTFPPIRMVALGQPLVWLARGWADLRANPFASLFYGACFSVMGLVQLVVFRFAVDYTSTLTMGFMLAGPFLAIGLYALSRQRERGESADFRATLVAWRENTGGIGIYVLILTVVFLVWARASLVTFALFESRAMPTWALFFQQITSLSNLAFVATFFSVGLLFASLVFAFSAVSIPYLLDRRADAVTAAAVSIMALVRNPLPMVLWALLIVLLIGIGMATAYVGLLVTGPLIGHATWHAYRDLVGVPTGTETPA
ncbi:MAG: DUF2189 domain-containing protein [Usitatibacteraceae bacterium]